MGPSNSLLKRANLRALAKVHSLKQTAYLGFRACEELQNRFMFHLPMGQKVPGEPAPRNILLCKTDSIGDFILFSTSLAAYRALYCDARIVLIVQDCAEELARQCPYVDEVWGINQQSFRRNPLVRWHWFRKIRRQRFDLAVNAAYSRAFEYFDCLTGWSGARQRVAFAADSEPPGRSSFYFTGLVPMERKLGFEIETNFRMLCYLGYKGKASYTTELWLHDDDLTFARRWLGTAAVGQYAVLFPGARLAAKIWPADNYARVLAAVSSEFPLHWVICGSSLDLPLCNYLAACLHEKGIHFTNFAGKTSLREFCGLTAGAVLYLGNDTMAAHVAAAVGVPGVCLVGGGHPGRFYPYPGNPLTTAVTNPMSCFNCNWRCSSGQYRCISEIPAETVTSHVRQVLQTSEEKDDDRA